MWRTGVVLGGDAEFLSPDLLDDVSADCLVRDGGEMALKRYDDAAMMACALITDCPEGSDSEGGTCQPE